jgi:hypothetical protein
VGSASIFSYRQILSIFIVGPLLYASLRERPEYVLTKALTWIKNCVTFFLAKYGQFITLKTLLNFKRFLCTPPIVRNLSKIFFAYNVFLFRCIAKNSLGHSDGSITLYGKFLKNYALFTSESSATKNFLLIFNFCRFSD